MVSIPVGPQSGGWLAMTLAATISNNIFFSRLFFLLKPSEYTITWQKLTGAPKNQKGDTFLGPLSHFELLTLQQLLPKKITDCILAWAVGVPVVTAVDWHNDSRPQKGQAKATIIIPIRPISESDKCQLKGRWGAVSS